MHVTHATCSCCAIRQEALPRHVTCNHLRMLTRTGSIYKPVLYARCMHESECHMQTIFRASRSGAWVGQATQARTLTRG